MENQSKVRQVMRAELGRLTFDQILHLPLNDIMNIARRAGVDEMAAINYVRGYIHGREDSNHGYNMSYA